VTASSGGECTAWADLSRADLEQRFTALLAEHGPALGRLAAAYARAAGERDDLFQEIAVAVWQALPRFRRECSERTFVFRIAHNRAVTHLARRRLDVVEANEELEIEDAAPDPEQALSSEQQGDRLLAAIQRLPIGYAQVVTLTLEGLSYADVADVLGITESNVGARLTRARDMLRRLLKDSHGT
jgi:RNA polymerase sigma factor (sigma-70 family)